MEPLHTFIEIKNKTYMKVNSTMKQNLDFLQIKIFIGEIILQY